ncbi:unnamed protein product [Pleuronectes platessa]|uniref:Uncharacterized protein n=1 Tax=Pleuronectes platessa TaxID=8262 RepID=A0A9N7YER7_PLEPL|nr:unnamed protein product [Pleuronectes platessa]
MALCEERGLRHMLEKQCTRTNLPEEQPVLHDSKRRNAPFADRLVSSLGTRSAGCSPIPPIPPLDWESAAVYKSSQAEPLEEGVRISSPTVCKNNINPQELNAPTAPFVPFITARTRFPRNTSHHFSPKR